MIADIEKKDDQVRSFSYIWIFNYLKLIFIIFPCFIILLLINFRLFFIISEFNVLDDDPHIGANIFLEDTSKFNPFGKIFICIIIIIIKIIIIIIYLECCCCCYIWLAGGFNNWGKLNLLNSSTYQSNWLID